MLESEIIIRIASKVLWPKLQRMPLQEGNKIKEPEHRLRLQLRNPLRNLIN